MTTKKEQHRQMMEEANRKVSHVACPRDYCRAKVGEPCLSAGTPGNPGNPTFPHTARRQLAERERCAYCKKPLPTGPYADPFTIDDKTYCDDGCAMAGWKGEV